MSYEVFTLKYRPRSFDDVVGQESVAATLKRAVQTDRVAHAYLLCGSRGVGKTSMARILAKALNCPQVNDGEPCNSCDVCLAIGRGEDLDVIEIDGASNRGIDDIRGIRDGAGYVPSRGRFKIYIIDEVHMLTIQAFNALLKVLEEPPAHVKFVFATTDPNALPDTILSRCQRHEFRRISEDDIVARLRQIADRENVTCDDAVLGAIARKAEGGLRDSVSLLDQVVSYAGNTISMADLEKAIGVLPLEHLEQLVTAVARQDLPGVLEAIRRAFWSGYDPQELLAAVTAWLRDYMVWHVDEEGRRGGRAEELYGELAGEMPLDRVLYLSKLFLNLRGDIKRAGHERIQLETTCIKAARSAGLLPVEEILERLRGKVAPPPQTAPASAGAAAPVQKKQASSSKPKSAPASPPVSRPPAPPTAEKPASASPRDRGPEAQGSQGGTATALEMEPQPGAGPDPARLRKAWFKIIDEVKLQSSMVASSLSQAEIEKLDDSGLLLAVAPGNTFLMERLSSTEALGMIAAAVNRVCGWTLKVRITQRTEEGGMGPVKKKSVYEDPTVRRFIEHFDGGVMDVERNDG